MNWIGIGASFETPPDPAPGEGRGRLLRMRYFLCAIIDLPHAEERPKGASRSTQDRSAGNSFGCSQLSVCGTQGIRPKLIPSSLSSRDSSSLASP